MSRIDEQGQSVIEAHQELVYRIEQGISRVRALSLATVVVSLVLAASYLTQLALPLFGVTVVTVDLTSASNQVVEIVALALAIAWLYVGARNLLFVRRVGPRIARARKSEDELAGRISPDKPPLRR